jgi:hypothetical protein
MFYRRCSGPCTQGSASESCLTATIAARERCLKILAVRGNNVQSNGSNGSIASNGSDDGSSTPLDRPKTPGTPGPSLLARIAEPLDLPSRRSKGTVHGSQEELDADIPHGVRSEWSSKLVMYGSTQTHSLGAKVSWTGGGGGGIWDGLLK